MTQIKIEVPANDHIALSAMADALQRIATERAPRDEMGVTQSDTETTPKPFSFMSSIAKGYKAAVDEESEDLKREEFKTPDSAVDVELNRLDEELEAFEETVAGPTFKSMISDGTLIPTKQDSTLDADGIPHDKRIHSKGATRLADNTWRLRKRPADKTEEEWTAYIDSVKAELKAVQDIPVTPPEAEFTEQQAIDHIGNTNDNPMDVVEPTLDEQAVADLTPPVTLTEEQAREEIKEKLESGEVTVEAPLTPPVIDTDTPHGMSEANETPVAPVTPPTSLTPPVVEADKPSVTTFQELMLYMTSDAKKRGADNDMIKATLLEVDPALTAIPLIATRADLIPKFVEALEAKLA